MSFGAIAGGIGALLSGGASVGSAIGSGSLNRKNRKWQEKMYKWQLQDQRDNAKMQWQENRDYADWSYKNFESPTAQRAAYKAAGINPFVEGSAMQPMGATQGSGSAPDSPTPPSSGPYQFNPGSVLQQGASAMREAAMQVEQIDNVRAQTEFVNAQRLRTLAETKGIENTNSMFDIVKATAESDLVSKRFAAALKEVESRYAEANALADVGQKQAKIAEINASTLDKLASAAKTDADRLTVDYLREAQKRSLDTGSDLNVAETAYKDTLRRVEDAKLEPFLQDMQSRIRNLDQSTLTEQQRTDLARYEAELKEILAKHERGPMREFLRKVETTGRSLWRFLLPSIGG